MGESNASKCKRLRAIHEDMRDCGAIESTITGDFPRAAAWAESSKRKVDQDLAWLVNLGYEAVENSELLKMTRKRHLQEKADLQADVRRARRSERLLDKALGKYRQAARKMRAEQPQHEELKDLRDRVRLLEERMLNAFPEE